MLYFGIIVKPIKHLVTRMHISKCQIWRTFLITMERVTYSQTFMNYIYYILYQKSITYTRVLSCT